MQHKQYYERVESRSSSSIGPVSDDDDDDDNVINVCADTIIQTSLLQHFHPHDEYVEEDSMIASLSAENLMLHDRVNELERQLATYESRISQQRVLIHQLQGIVCSMENSEMSGICPDPSEEDMAILRAVENGESSLMIALLCSSPSGQSSDMILGRIGSNALQIACQMGYLDIVKWLLETGDVDVHADYDSALQWAAKRGDKDIVQVLLRNGADPTVLNGCALRIALDRGHNDVAKLFMEHVSTCTNKNQVDCMLI